MRTRHVTRLSAVVVTAIVVAACQASDAPDDAGGTDPAAGTTAEPADEPPTTSETARGAVPVELVATLIGERGDDLSNSYVVIVEDVRDGVDDAIRPLEDRVASLRSIIGLLPDAGSAATSSTTVTRYEEMTGALEAWHAAAAAVRDEARRRADELEPIIADWAQEGAGATAPGAYVELLRGDEDEATAFGDACAAFADEAGVTLDCYLVPAAEPVVTSYELAIGDVRLTMDVEDVEHDSPVDGGVCVASARPGTIMVVAPPDLADPAARLHRDPSTAIPSTVPWPEDLGDWYAQLPVEVLATGEEVLSDGAITWSYVVLAATDESGGPFLAIDGGRCFWRLGDIFELVLWETTIDGQRVVAVSDGRPDRAYEDHLEEARQVLDTVRLNAG